MKFQSVQFTADQKLVDFAEGRVAKYGRITDQIIDTKVTLKLENSGQVKDKVAEIMVLVPGDQFVAQSSSKTFEQSIDEASDALERQLKKWKGKSQERIRS